MTPLAYFVKKYQKTSEDFIGRFYGEFMGYSGGNGQTLGIILTPRHITDLMRDLVDVRADNVVLEQYLSFLAEREAQKSS